MLIPCDEVNILNTFRVMIILRLLLLLTNLHLKLLSTQGTGTDKLLSTQRVKEHYAAGIFTCDGCARDPYFYVPAETQSYVIKLSCSWKVLAASGV